MMTKKESCLLLGLIFIIGFLIRAVEVLTNNYVFLYDQGRDYLAVRDLVFNRQLTLIGAPTGLEGIFSGPAWYYLLAVPFILWRGDPLGGQVLMLVCGLLVMALAFWFTNKVYGKITALLAFFLVAISRPVMSQATIIWNPNPAPICIFLSWYFIYRYLKIPKGFYLGLVFFIIGSMYHFEFTVCLASLFYTLAFLIFITKSRLFKHLGWLIGGLGLAFSPALLFDFRHRFLQTKIIWKFITGGQAGLSSPNFSWWFIKDHWQSFWAHFQNTFNQPSSLFMALLVIFITEFFIRKAKHFAENQRLFSYYLLLFPFATFIFYIFFPNPVWQWYLTHLYFVYLLLAAIVVNQLFQDGGYRRWLAAGFLLVMTVSGLQVLHSRYEYDYHDSRGVAGIKSKLQALDYIYQDATGEPFSLFVFTPPVYDYAYRYLVQWHAQNRYHYLPGNRKEGLFYLWIEPDSQKPWSYQGWLETVIGKGKVLEEKVLPSGFIIQKRYAEEN